jgi:glycosyltransferase 2 family protein
VKYARILVGILISALFAWLTVSRVDLAAVGQALGKAAPLGVVIALGFAWLEIAARAWRWRFLLSPLGRVSYRHSLAYTCVGYFANTLLPMRLGDVARAYLAATALRLPRTATLGSIITERLADGMTILLVAAGLGLVVTDASKVASVEAWTVLAVAAAFLLMAMAMLVSRHRQRVASHLPERLRLVAAKLVLGTKGVQSVRGFGVTVGSTLVAYCFAVGAMVAVSSSVGLSITPAEAAFAMAWIGLSTAIPAAPGSVGTYEFVGVSVLTMLGQDPDAALAAVVLLHVIGTVPVALVGLATTWVLHLRVWRVELGPVPLQAEVV